MAERSRSEAAVLSVSAVNQLVNRVLEAGLPRSVAVSGEISNFKRAAGGHLYFTLKDAQAALSVVMWRSAADRLGFSPGDGDAVVATGSVSVFAPQGRYQLYASSLRPVGAGELDRQLRALHARLEAEGLFDSRRKKPLPLFARLVGLVTSRQSAAVRDMVRAIRRRNPAVRIRLWAVPVQGPGAAQAIAEAIGHADSLVGEERPDVLIVGRGGGSLEDLWAFNEEVAVRAVAGCSIPLISAVGHEIDTSLCCLAADVRAATPTAGAELAVARRADLLEQMATRVGRIGQATGFALRTRAQQLDGLVDRSESAVRRRVDGLLHRLSILGERLAHTSPAAQLVRRAERLSELGRRAERAGVGQVRLRLDRLDRLERRMLGRSPEREVGRWQARLGLLEQRGVAAARGAAEQQGLRLGHLAALLASVDPRRVLLRGYSITRRASDGEILLDPQAAAAGTGLVSELAGGSLSSVAGSLDQIAGQLPVRIVPARAAVRRRSRQTGEANQPRLFE